MAEDCFVCGIVGKDFGENTIKTFVGKWITYMRENRLSQKVLLAKDNRGTGDYITAIMQAIFLKNGIDVDLLGVSTSPELAYLANKFKYGLGMMITAPKSSEFNGIQVYSSVVEGGKVPKKKYGRCKQVDELEECYIRKLKNELKCKNKYIFDCANGSTVGVIRKIFPRHKLIGDDCSGEYVNDCFGMNHIQTLSNLCKKTHMSGFAFSEDGRGVVAVDEQGRVIDGDEIVYILSKFYLSAGDKVCVCNGSSLGLDVSLRKFGVSVIRGDVDADIRCDMFGNITLEGWKCADGVLIAIKLISILEQSKMNFDELLKDYKRYYIKRGEVMTTKNIKGAISKDFRLVVDKIDGTTTKVFVEGLDKGLVEQEFDKIMKDLKL